MHETLKLVAGGAAQRDIVPILTHFWFHGGRVQAGDSRIAIDAPLQCPELEGRCVPADKLLAATDPQQGGQPRFTVTPAGFLQVQRGRSRVKLPMRSSSDYSPVAEPPADEPVGSIAVPPLRLLREFVSENAIHTWSIGVLLRDGYAYATTGVNFLARLPIEYRGPELCIPVYCLEKILALPFGQYDVRATEDGRGIYLSNSNVWVYSVTLNQRWPDVSKFFDGWQEPPSVDIVSLRTALDIVAPFIPDQKRPDIHFRDGELRTDDGEYSAAVEGMDIANSSWRYETLAVLVKHATHIDFAAYPNPVRWVGGDMQGVATGVKA